jgi:hypothetical protein
MSELIVLGLIPGTHIQITFILWILMVTVLLTAALVSIARRTHLLRNWIVAIRIFMLMRQTISQP